MEYEQILYTLQIVTKRKTLIKKEILAYEPKHLDVDIGNIRLVIHHEYAGHRQKPNWLVSEYITGLKITTTPRRTRDLALADAIQYIKSYGIEKFRQFVNSGGNLSPANVIVGNQASVAKPRCTSPVRVNSPPAFVSGKGEGKLNMLIESDKKALEIVSGRLAATAKRLLNVKEFLERVEFVEFTGISPDIEMSIEDVLACREDIERMLLE